MVVKVVAPTLARAAVHYGKNATFGELITSAAGVWFRCCHASLLLCPAACCCCPKFPAHKVCVCTPDDEDDSRLVCDSFGRGEGSTQQQLQQQQRTQHNVCAFWTARRGGVWWFAMQQARRPEMDPRPPTRKCKDALVCLLFIHVVGGGRLHGIHTARRTNRAHVCVCVVYGGCVLGPLLSRERLCVCAKRGARVDLLTPCEAPKSQLGKKKQVLARAQRWECVARL